MTISAISKSAIQTIRAMALGKNIVFVSGTFNIVHPGHLRLLRFAAECGDLLVVGVLSDRLASRAQLQETMRLDGVDAISLVSHAFSLDDAPADFISELQPSVVVMGNEHENANNPEQPVVKAYGGKLLFGSGSTTFSSLEILRRETEFIDHSSIIKPKEYITRHGIDVSSLNKLLDQMRSLNVCVIGDTIVDEYIQCDPLGMSQEDPTIVVTPLMVNKFLGGAGIVAAHARGLGAGKVSFITVTGDDDTSTYVADKLKNYGVEANLVIDDSRPTTLKQRYRVGNKTLLRVSHLRQHKINKTLQREMRDHVFAALDRIDVLIFSDFNYGALPQDLVDEISHECTRRGIMMVADSQSSSQVGDVSRFKNSTLLTPTEREARLALGNYEDGLVVLAEALRKKTNALNVVITLGAEGVLIHASNLDKTQWLTDRLPTLNVAPKDAAGAGDCLLVCSAMALSLGRPVWESLYLGSVAAACHVGRIGNIPLTAAELLIETQKNNGTL
ncbi:MAG TPA: ADP-heptose synthase [Gammaproteobacteria bacterium]|nr:ADP-heptose synthase [Gammaproteobacteria bacterium]